ncbi:MAG: RNB domain-containing ribonuclease [Thermoleophilia bacterium]|nr:RNB domain-containing ribonuclease [Thermoleophilia bacterium]
MNDVVVEVTKRGKLLVGEPFFVPGTPLLLDRKGSGAAGPGDLAVARRPARGRARIERVLGRADDVEAVLEGLLVDAGERAPFEPHALPEPSVEGRADLRDLVTFTIDPETAKDFDDAISARREGDGGRVWVHIADVGHFVAVGTPLDRGATARGFSVYVPGRVAPMLPPALADDACSLRPHVDRLCVTVEIPFGPSLAIGEAAFYRSVIRSRERLTYGRAEAVLAGRERLDAELGDALRLADGVARELRRRRFARGALRIETPELAFAFDGRGGVERAWLEGEPEAHALVEELMILANEAVAGLLASRRRTALYRVHERPDPQAVSLLVAKLADLDVPTPPAPPDTKLTPAEAARLAAAVGERVAAYVERAGRGREAFPSLVLRAHKQARYDPANLGHTGLASPAYCHFTSPIRRYPDLVCHRALLRELGADDAPLPDDLGEVAAHTSARERAAAELEYRADDVCLAWLLERELYERGWDATWEGEITGVIGSGVFVRFGEVFEGYLPVRRIPGDYFELNALGTALVGRASRRTYRLGDPIEVLVEDIRRAEGKVELRM